MPQPDHFKAFSPMSNDKNKAAPAPANAPSSNFLRAIV